MDTKTYTITLADGTVLDELTLNGNNYISREPISPEVFVGNLSPVVIRDGETEEIHDHMALVQCKQVAGETWFILRDLTAQEIRDIKTQADIEYLAMMVDVEL